MEKIQKIGVYFSMCFFAVFVAGIYGVFHDQISYTFSSEYFTHFKFKQFAIPWAYENPRFGAAYVGFLATWWMGVLVYLPLGLFGFMFTTPRQMGTYLAKSLIVVVIVALVTGLLGLLYGYYQITESTNASNIHCACIGVTEQIQFARVGYMHNASYAGGVTGLVAGVLYLVRAKLRYDKMF
ncbi:MAG: hypothetical protein ABUK01_09030 [Leptospirales bacterium]